MNAPSIVISVALKHCSIPSSAAVPLASYAVGDELFNRVFDGDTVDRERRRECPPRRRVRLAFPMTPWGNRAGSAPRGTHQLRHQLATIATYPAAPIGTLPPVGIT